MDLLCATLDKAGIADWMITAINSLRWLIPRIIVLGFWTLGWAVIASCSSI